MGVGFTGTHRFQDPDSGRTVQCTLTDDVSRRCEVPTDAYAPGEVLFPVSGIKLAIPAQMQGRIIGTENIPPRVGCPRGGGGFDWVDVHFSNVQAMTEQELKEICN
jgi:hypothetical protein